MQCESQAAKPLIGAGSEHVPGVKLLNLRSVAAVTGRYMKDFFGKLKLVEKCWTHAQKPGQDKVYSMGLGI